MAMLSREYPPNRMYVFESHRSLGSQFSKYTLRIIRTPEMMWPRNGTTISGFLALSAHNNVPILLLFVMLFLELSTRLRYFTMLGEGPVNT